MFLLFFLFVPFTTAAQLEQLNDLRDRAQTVVAAGTFNDWIFNPYITQEERKWITPYLMPEEHLIRKKLDRIFKKSRATSDRESLIQAGFSVFHSGSKTRIATHPDLIDETGQRYLIKFHYDNDLQHINPFCKQPNTLYFHLCRSCPSWKQLLNRAMGAKKIEKALDILGYKRFIVAKEWLYPLPLYPYKRKEGYSRKNYILVVERLSLFPYEANKNLWKMRITKEMLHELYTVMSIGLADVSHENAPFTRSGKWAFIDTECCFCAQPGFSLHPHPGESLNEEMAAYWQELCQSNAYHYKILLEK